MNIHFFVCFHNLVNLDIYHITEEEKSNITLYGVKNAFESSYDTIYEDELQIYKPELQLNSYNEGSCLYHIYMNNIHKKYDYIGFVQYDMMFEKDIFKNIQTGIVQNSNTIFYVDFFLEKFMGGQSIILRDYPQLKNGLDSYNAFFNTNYTKDHLHNNNMIAFNAFLIPTKMYEKMMSWLERYFIEDIECAIMDIEYRIMFNPGHIIEALTSMFLCLETYNGAVYKKMEIEHHMNYKN